MSIFPAELIFNILYYCDPRDILRWRAVSKWFRAIACDDVLWRSLYTDAHFPCPPGPSPSQSIAVLERMLVKSAQLAQSWTTRPMRGISSVRIEPEKPFAVLPLKLIGGRWLAGCQEARRFVLYNVEPSSKGHAPKVLWEQEQPVESWDMHSMSPVEGQFVVYVLVEWRATWKLLEFQLNDESGEIYESTATDSPPWARRLSTAELNGGKSRFLWIWTYRPEGVVFDTRTRKFYELPPSRIPLTFPRFLFRSPECLMEFTDTHIIAFHYHKDASRGPMTLIRIFTIPPDGSPVKGSNPVVCLTHEGFANSYISNTESMKPSINPITGATHMRFLRQYSYHPEPKITCIDLILPRSSGLEVLPVTVDMHDIGIPMEGIKSGYTGYLGLCDDRLLRGFYRGEYRQDGQKPIIKFTIDTSQDPWAVTCGQLAPSEWSDISDPEVHSDIVFDGLRGRLCYVDPKIRPQVQIVVADVE